MEGAHPLRKVKIEDDLDFSNDVVTLLVDEKFGALSLVKNLISLFKELITFSFPRQALRIVLRLEIPKRKDDFIRIAFCLLKFINPKNKRSDLNIEVNSVNQEKQRK